MARDPAAQARLEERAAALYTARSIADDTSSGPIVSFDRLLRHVVDPAGGLTEEELLRVAANERLSADLARLEREHMIFELPRLAAASSEPVTERRLGGAWLRITPSRAAGQVYVSIELDDAARAPRVLVLRGENGETHRAGLPDPDGDGRILLLLDIALRPEDARFVRLLRDPLSSGGLFA